MSKYLISLSLPEPHAGLVEPMLKSATCFFETSGTVERTELGSFRRRAAKGTATEVARLVLLTASDSLEPGAHLGRARTLESVLRSTLTSAGVQAGDVRVFLAEPS